MKRMGDIMTRGYGGPQWSFVSTTVPRRLPRRVDWGITHRGERPVTLGYKLIDAGGEIIAMFTGRSRQASRDLMHAATFRVLAEAGLREMPGDETPLETRYQLVRASIDRVAQELERLHVPREKIDRVSAELDAFYRGVRGIDADRKAE